MVSKKERSPIEMVIWMKHKVSCIVWCLIFCLNPFFWLTSFFPSLNWLWEKFMCTLCHKTNQLPPKLSPVASNNISRGQIGKTGLITMYCVTHTYTYIQKIEALSWIVALFGPDELYGTYRVWWYYFRISNHLKWWEGQSYCESSMEKFFLHILFYWVCNGCEDSFLFGSDWLVWYMPNPEEY